MRASGSLPLTSPFPSAQMPMPPMPPQMSTKKARQRTSVHERSSRLFCTFGSSFGLQHAAPMRRKEALCILNDPFGGLGVRGDNTRAHKKADFPHFIR